MNLSETLEQPKQELWAIIELMGHDRTAGRYTFQDGLHRIDVPRQDGTFVTEMIGNSAIFRLRFVDEAAARMAARSIEPQPIGVWELQKELKRLAAPVQPGTTIEGDFEGDVKINQMVDRDFYGYDEDEEI